MVWSDNFQLFSLDRVLQITLITFLNFVFDFEIATLCYSRVSVKVEKFEKKHIIVSISKLKSKFKNVINVICRTRSIDHNWKFSDQTIKYFG